MKFRNFRSFRLQDPSLDTGGTGTGVVDRGDLLPEPAAPAAVTPPAEDPKVKELEVELGLKGEGEEPGEGEEGEPAEGAKPPAKDSRIPAARHKEILEKERAKTAALAAENALLKQRGQLEATTVEASAEFAKIETKIEALEADYARLLTDGELAKAADVMKQIRSAERGMAEAKADLKIQAANAVAQETARFQTALTRIETAYPALNPDHEDFDERAEARVARMNNANRAAGMSAVAALQDAVETVMGTETAQQEKATSVTPRVPKDVGAERKAAAVEKAVKAVAATPPSLGRTGLDSDKLGGGKLDPKSVASMSQEQFAALSDATLAEMRGDTI